MGREEALKKLICSLVSGDGCTMERKYINNYVIMIITIIMTDGVYKAVSLSREHSENNK